MPTQVILKPAGLALTALGVVALAALAIPRLSGPGAPSENAPEHRPAKAAAARPEKEFWCSSNDPKEKQVLVVDTDPSVPSQTSQVAHVKITKSHGEGWKLQTGVGIGTEQHAGDKHVVSFWARADAPDTPITVAIEFNYAPYEKFANQNLTLSSQWKEYHVPVTFTKAVPVDKGNISFQIGQATADCYFSGVTIN